MEGEGDYPVASHHPRAGTPAVEHTYSSKPPLLPTLIAGVLYAAYGGQAYPFMALLSAAGLVGVWQLRRAAP